MSYQIKRTPYFQRLFNNSKRNGQLQRLREEYERIQEFNDRTIEMKMRQVRLKRLFREIEDINESPGGGITNDYFRQHALVPLTPEAMQAQRRRERMLSIERSRELGQEISRRNAALAETGNSFYFRNELRLTSKMRAAEDMRRDALERRQRAARRLSYGNAQSRSNMERSVQRRQRRQITNTTDPGTTSLMLDADDQGIELSQMNQPQSTQSSQLMQLSPQPRPITHMHALTQVQLKADLDKRAAMLQQRLQYGNSRSCNNMIRRHLSAAQRTYGLSGSDTLTENEEHQLELQQQLAQQELLKRQEPPLFELAGSSSSKNINDVANNNSDLDMQTALLPPTETEPTRLDDEIPSTSHDALRVAHLSELANTIATDLEQPDVKEIVTTAAAVTTTRQSISTSGLVPKRLNRISVTLPWIKVIRDHPMIAANQLSAGQLANLSIAIGGGELGINQNTASNITDNYQSFRGQSLLQEDLMQIVELDEGDQMPSNMRLINQTYDNTVV